MWRDGVNSSRNYKFYILNKARNYSTYDGESNYFVSYLKLCRKRLFSLGTNEKLTELFNIELYT